MSTALTLALAALTLAQPQTDTVIPLEGAERLSVEAPGGSITVTTWTRQEVRIVAEHSSRTYIDIDHRGSTIDVDAEARRGPATIVDYQITVPAGLDLELEGFYTNITVEGADGDVEAETNQGDIRIVGGRGSIEASTVSGSVVVEGAEGTVDVSSVAQGVRVRDASGEVYAETVGGTIALENLRARAVEAGSVGGRIEFDGELQDGGHYFFGSHGGSITVRVPQGAGATFHVATVHGGVSTDLPGAPEQFERGQRHSFTVGGGGALVETETFSGRINLVHR
ncbi:MAG: hypothetical protein PVI57_09860 [Gemmatimonadota bacterium]|jgi:DUF4097 and DUF4098 domain-containing protein YvlB